MRGGIQELGMGDFSSNLYIKIFSSAGKLFQENYQTLPHSINTIYFSCIKRFDYETEFLVNREG